MPDKSVPAPYGKVTPYLCIAGAAKALDFYKGAFGAKERVRIELPNGLTRLIHRGPDFGLASVV